MGKSVQNISFDDKLIIASNNEVSCYMLGDEIFYAFFNANSNNSSEEMDFVFKAYHQQVKQQPLKVIIELDEYAQLDRSAREYWKNILQKESVKPLLLRVWLKE